MLDINALPRGDPLGCNKKRPKLSSMLEVVNREEVRLEKTRSSRRNGAASAETVHVQNVNESETFVAKLSREINFVVRPSVKPGTKMLAYVQSRDKKQKQFNVSLLHCLDIEISFEHLKSLSVSDDETSTNVVPILSTGSFIMIYALSCSGEIEFTVKPSLCNESTPLQIDSIFQGIVVSVQSHGTIVDIGVGKRSVCIKCVEHTFKLGQLVLCRITAIKKKYMYAEPMSTVTPFISAGFSEFSEIIVGKSYDATVRFAGSVGIVAQIGPFHCKISTISIPHGKKFGEGDSITVVPVLINSAKEEIICSMSKFLLEGEKIENIDTESTLSTGIDLRRGDDFVLVHESFDHKIFLPRTSIVEKAPGKFISSIDLQLHHVSPLENVLVGTNGKVKKGTNELEKLALGQKISGKVVFFGDESINISLSERLAGELSYTHLRDNGRGGIVGAKKAFSEGSSIECRVLSIRPHDNKVFLTARPKLMSPAFKLFKSYEEIKSGDDFIGWIKEIHEGFYVIQHFCGLTACLLKSQVPKDLSTDKSIELKLHQTVTARVVECMPDRRRLTVSMKPVSSTVLPEVVKITLETPLLTHRFIENGSLMLGWVESRDDSQMTYCISLPHCLDTSISFDQVQSVASCLPDNNDLTIELTTGSFVAVFVQVSEAHNQPRSVQLLLQPSVVNQFCSLETGSVVQGVIVAVESHGVVCDIGVGTKSLFIKTDNNKSLKLGHLLLCRITQNNPKKYLFGEVVVQGPASPIKNKPTSLRQIILGAVYKAIVTQSGPFGFLAQIGEVTCKVGAISIPSNEVYQIGDSVKVVPVYINSSNGEVYCSLSEFLLLGSSLSEIDTNSMFQCDFVMKRSNNLVLTCEDLGRKVFVPESAFKNPPGHVESLPVRLIEKISILENALMAVPVLCNEKIGQRITGKIVSFGADGIKVSLPEMNDLEKGTGRIPYEHTSDRALQDKASLHASFKKGSSIDCRILSTGKVPLLTSRQAILGPQFRLFRSYTEIKKGDLFIGWVVKKAPTYILLRHFEITAALVGNRSIGPDGEACELMEGHSVKAEVISVDPENEKCAVSLAPLARYFSIHGVEKFNDSIALNSTSSIDFGGFSVGQFVNGTVKYTKDDFTIVSVSDKLSGILHFRHVSDMPVPYNSLVGDFPPKTVLKCRILDIDTEKKRVTLTTRSLMMTPSVKIHACLESVKVGDSWIGWVENVTQAGCYVHHFNKLKAYLPRDHSVYLKNSQTLVCRVIETGCKEHPGTSIVLTSSVDQNESHVSVIEGNEKSTSTPVVADADIDNEDPRGSIVSATIKSKKGNHFTVSFHFRGVNHVGVLSKNHLHDYNSISEMLFSVYKKQTVLSKVMIITFKVSDTENKIEVSCKTSLLNSTPSQSLPKFSQVVGFVKEITELGAFIQVPKSTFCFAPKDFNKTDFLQIGQTVHGQITDADYTKKRYVINLKVQSSNILRTLRELLLNIENISSDGSVDISSIIIGSSETCIITDQQNDNGCSLLFKAATGFIPGFINKIREENGQSVPCFVIGYDTEKKQVLLAPRSSGVETVRIYQEHPVLIVHETSDFYVGRFSETQSCFVILSRRNTCNDPPGNSLLFQTLDVYVRDKYRDNLYLGLTKDQNQVQTGLSQSANKELEGYVEKLKNMHPFGSQVNVTVVRVRACFLCVKLPGGYSGEVFLGSAEEREGGLVEGKVISNIFQKTVGTEIAAYVQGYKNVRNRGALEMTSASTGKIVVLLSVTEPDNFYGDEVFDERDYEHKQEDIDRLLAKKLVGGLVSKLLDDRLIVRISHTLYATVWHNELSNNQLTLNRINVHYPPGTYIKGTLRGGYSPKLGTYYALSLIDTELELGQKVCARKVANKIIFMGKESTFDGELNSNKDGFYFKCYIAKILPNNGGFVLSQKPIGDFSEADKYNAKQFRKRQTNANVSEDNMISSKRARREEDLETVETVLPVIHRKRANPDDLGVSIGPLQVDWEESVDSPPMEKASKQVNVADFPEINVHKPKIENWITVEELELSVTVDSDSGSNWVTYMRYYADLDNVAQVRNIAERALESISDQMEDEKMKVWYCLLEIENSSGTEETLEDAFASAIQRCNPLKVHFKLADIYASTGKTAKAAEAYRQTIKKFKTEKSVWLKYLEFLFKNGRSSETQSVLDHSFKALEKKEHVDIISKFAQLEFKYGEVERGKTHFESILSCYPKRTDVWSVYIDMLVGKQEIETVRQLFDRILCLQLTKYKMRFFFKKFADIESLHGTEAQQNYVSQKAMEYVEKEKTNLESNLGS